MKLQTNTPWSGETGPNGDVVLSSRVRLARNLTGFPFVNRASTDQCDAIIRLAEAEVSLASM